MVSLISPDVLARVSAIGPYFAVTTGSRPDSGEFRPMADLYADPGALENCVRAVTGRLGTHQPRVAASTLHLGTASRLWSVALACAALTGRVPDLEPDRLRWRLASSGPLDLWLPAIRELPQDPVTALHHSVATQNLAPWADAVRRASGVSPHTLRGNAASALIGAHRVLLARLPYSPHQAVSAVPVVPVVRELLSRPPLADAGACGTRPDGTIAFRRRSCCLYYRVPGAGTCGDCVLNHQETNP